MTVPDINPVTTYEIEDGVAIVTFDSPPVNALGLAVRQGIGGGQGIAVLLERV